MTVLAQRKLVCHEHGRVFRKVRFNKEHWRPPPPARHNLIVFWTLDFKNIPLVIMVAVIYPAHAGQLSRISHFNTCCNERFNCSWASLTSASVSVLSGARNVNEYAMDFFPVGIELPR
jgi:hypothetical protein